MDPLFALLVHDRPHPLDRLKDELNALSIHTFCAQSCEEAGRLISQAHPHIIFSDTTLPDGTWADVIKLGAKALVPANVIVVGVADDINLYVSVLEGGAFDYIAPPFTGVGLDLVVKSAGRNASLRRQAHAFASAY